MQARALDQPYRSASMRFINAAGHFLERCHLPPARLEKSVLLAKAIKHAGCRDFGDPGFHKGLDHLLDSLENEAQLTPLGRLMAQTEIVGRLTSRLRLIDWRKKHPEVADEPIRQPLFILGLPRTGTTILHALLAVDPANRSPLFWELEYPVPPATPASWRDDARIFKTERGLAQFNSFCPGIQAVHLMEARLQQECVAMLAMDMRAEQFYTMYNVPSYANWLLGEDKAFALQFHRQILQHLQSGGVRGERWLLKSPGHLHLIRNLLAVYPDARIIHTHRNPLTVCASISSMTAMLRGVGSDAIDLKLIGRQQLELWAEMLARALVQRQQLAAEGRDGQFLDLQMQEITTDPLAAVERIYAHFGYVLAPAVRAEMARFMRDNPRDKHGTHHYQLEDFGLDAQRDAVHFRRYCEYFRIDCRD
ncbi:MAG: sulfotransferase [Sterolibacterium sp.]|nr:sulfotransferase [Sterolibacterium sp.]